MLEIPGYGLRAYALFYSKYGSSQSFRQSSLDWLVSEPMKKKIFSLLLKAGWITKANRQEYKCVSPDKTISGLLDFRVPAVLKKATLPYALTGASAVEVWSDYSYVQRSLDRSPYFLKVLKKDIHKWKAFFNAESIPYYVKNGSTIGEFIILLPVEKLNFVEKNELKVEPKKETISENESNNLYKYPLAYIKAKYGG